MNRNLGARLAKSGQRMQRDIRRSRRRPRGRKKEKKRTDLVAPAARPMNRDRFATPASTWVAVGTVSLVFVTIVASLLYKLYL